MPDPEKEIVADGGDDKKVDDKKVDDKKKLTFDADQQAWVNAKIDDSYTKAFNKAKELADAQVAVLQAEINELKKPKVEVKAEVKADGEKKSPEAEELVVIKARLDELAGIAENLKAEKDAALLVTKEQDAKNRDTRIKEKFITIADKFNFFERMDVWLLTKDQFALNDEDDVIIINPATKQPRKNSELGDMTLEQFLSDFSTKKPQMVRSSNSDSGTGAGESRKLETREKRDIPDYLKMSKADFLKLTKEVEAKQYTDRK